MCLSINIWVDTQEMPQSWSTALPSPPPPPPGPPHTHTKKEESRNNYGQHKRLIWNHRRTTKGPQQRNHLGTVSTKRKTTGVGGWEWGVGKGWGKGGFNQFYLRETYKSALSSNLIDVFIVQELRLCYVSFNGKLHILHTDIRTHLHMY